MSSPTPPPDTCAFKPPSSNLSPGLHHPHKREARHPYSAAVDEPGAPPAPEGWPPSGLPPPVTLGCAPLCPAQPRLPPSLTLPTSQKEYPGRFWGLRPPPDPGHLLDADAGEPARRSPIYRCRERPPSPWFRSFRPTWSPPSPKQRAPGGLAPSLPEVAPELTQMAAARSQARCPLSAFQHVSVSAFPLTAPAAASARSSAVSSPPYTAGRQRRHPRPPPPRPHPPSTHPPADSDHAATSATSRSTAHTAGE